MRAHLRSNIVGYVALFIALSAGAYAAGLPKDSVKSKQIKAGAVKTAELAGSAVDGSKVADGSLSNADFGGSLPAGPPGPEGPEGPAGSPDTGPQILSKLAPVDGAGSGLDADRLDGLDSDKVARGGGFLSGGAAAAPQSQVRVISYGAYPDFSPEGAYFEVQYTCPGTQAGAGTVTFANQRSVGGHVFFDTGGSTPAQHAVIAGDASASQAITPSASTNLAHATVQMWWEDGQVATTWAFIEHRPSDCHIQGQSLVSFSRTGT